MTLLQDLRDAAPTLPPALLAAARAVLEAPGEAVTLSMRALAQRAGLPPATLVRLAQHTGHAGWRELKARLAQELGLARPDYGQRAAALRQPGATSFGGLTAAQQANLAQAGANAAALPPAATLLRDAQSVHVAGYRACFGLATTFAYVCGLLRPRVHLLDGAGGALEAQLRGVGARDALLVASFAPYSREAVAAVRAAAAAGARIVALADSAGAPIALQAHATLVFATTSPSFFPSTVAAQALLEALLQQLAATADEAAIARLRQAQQVLHASGAYVQPTARASRKRSAQP